MVNPCFCGCDLQTATKIIAVVDIASYCVLAMSTAIGGVYVIAQSSNDEFAAKTKSEVTTSSLIVTFCIALIICIAGIYLGLYLKKGADQKSYKICRNWLIIIVIFLVVDLIQYIALIRPSPTPKLMVNGLMLGYRVFAAWVVYEFVQELKANRAQVISAVSAQRTGIATTTMTALSHKEGGNIV